MTGFQIYGPGFRSQTDHLDVAVTVECGASRRCGHSRMRSVSIPQSQSNADRLAIAVTVECGLSRRRSHSRTGFAAYIRIMADQGKWDLYRMWCPLAGNGGLLKKKKSSLLCGEGILPGQDILCGEESFFTQTVSRSRMQSIRVRRALR